MLRPTPTGSTALLFQAPPAAELPDDYDPDLDQDFDRASRPHGRADHRPAPPVPEPGQAPLRMLRGAREAATGMGLTDGQVRAVLDDPTEVGPDPKKPQSTRMWRDGVEVIVGADGMIVRVSRRRR